MYWEIYIPKQTSFWKTQIEFYKGMQLESKERANSAS